MMALYTGAIIARQQIDSLRGLFKNVQLLLAW